VADKIIVKTESVYVEFDTSDERAEQIVEFAYACMKKRISHYPRPLPGWEYEEPQPGA
jgi:hypothetical protein